MNDARIMQMLKGAETVINICAQVKPNERVLIITDSEIDATIAYALAAASYNRGAEPVVATMIPRKAHAEDPPEPICQAMLVADVIITPTSKTIYHAPVTREACNRGARFLSMTGALPTTLMRGAITADFEQIKPVVLNLAQKFTEAKKLRLRTSAGTDIAADIEGRVGEAEPGIADKPGTLIGIPCIEANVTPIEESTQGRFIVDVTATDFGFVDKPIEIRVKNGVATEINGGQTAQKLQKLLAGANDPKQYIIAEFGFGLNPNAELQGRIIEDEAARGTCHIALGDNINLGGKNKAPMHIDLILKDPVLELDGKIVIDKEQILV